MTACVILRSAKRELKDSMRLWKTFALAAFPLAAAFGVVTPATAQCLPGNYDAARGIKGGDCYATAEINKAMKALDQHSLIYGDRITLGDNANGEMVVGGNLNIFTSNPSGTLGYNIEGDVPAGGQQAAHFSVRSVMHDVRLWDRNKKVLPPPEVIGRLNAQGLQKSGDRLMLSAKFGKGVYLVVVVSGAKQQVGSFIASNDIKGGELATLKGLAYTKAAEDLIKQQDAK